MGDEEESSSPPKRTPTALVVTTAKQPVHQQTLSSLFFSTATSLLQALVPDDVVTEGEEGKEEATEPGTGEFQSIHYGGFARQCADT